jgi:arylsulfatase A-like enzyme
MKPRVALEIILAGMTASVAASAAAQPNILVIVADDLGGRDLGCYNPNTFYETPNLDRLAAQGVRFTNGYAANPVCSPTRFSLMTGRYPTRVGATYWFGGGNAGKSFDVKPPKVAQHMPLDEVTLADGLKKAGYQTAFTGKWHLGEDEKYWPEKRGFDTNIAGWSKGHPDSYFPPYKNPRLKDGPPGEYLTERLVKESLGLMRAMAADKSRPFLLYHSFYQVHTPLQAPAELVDKYKNKAKKPGLDDGGDFGTEEQNWPVKAPRVIRTRQGNPVYAAMVGEMDAAAGLLLDELEKLGIAENTLVVFISDNGGLATNKNGSTSNLPLRAGKGWLYEGGIREPFMMRWPAAFKGGVSIDEPVMSIDVLPTVFAAAGAPLPSHPGRPIDGCDLLPLLKTGKAPARDALFWHFPHYGAQGGFPGAAVRMGDWKLIERFTNGRVQLYNLKDDIGEQNDLSAAEPRRVAAMKARLHAWYKETGAKFMEQKPGGPKPWRPDDNP